MNKPYSDDDLIRKPWMRLIIMAMGILCLVFGTQHYMFFHNWKGIFVVVMGIGFMWIINNAYENLLNEKELKNVRGK